MKNGSLQNLALNLPEQPKREGPLKAPFSVVSASEAELDIDVDGIRLLGHEIDADVTTDADPDGGTAFEVALRMATARARTVRTITEATSNNPAEYSVDEDVLCRIDARARIESKRVLIRRFSTFGAVDFDPAEEASPGCGIAKSDARYVEVALGHFSVALPVVAPTSLNDLPRFSGHARVRVPLGVVNRAPNLPPLVGWVLLDAELRQSPGTPLPEMTGSLEAKDIKVDRYNFAQSIVSEFTVQRSIFSSPHTRVHIADGVADISDLEVQPLAKGVPIKSSKIEATNASFASLMKQLSFAQHPHVTWDLDDIRTVGFQGTLDPLHLDGDITGHTKNFAVFDRAIDDPLRTRAVGTKEGHFAGKVAVRPDALQFKQINVRTTHSTIDQLLVSIGFHGVIHIDIPRAKIDISDVSPLGNVPMSGVADVSVTVDGPFANPHLEGDIANIANF